MSAHTIEAVLTAKDQGFTSTFDKALNKTQTFGQKLKGGLGFGAWMAIGQKAVSSVTNLISSSMGGAVKRLDTLNAFPKVMKSLGFETKQAESSINTLASGIEFLPTTLDNVASQTQQVVAVMGDLDKATRLTLALNNAMASGGASAEQQASAINQWVQAMAKGKPDLQDWRALVQTAPAQMNQLAEATLGAGKTQNDLYEAMKNGSVSIDEVSNKMIELSEKGGKGITSWAEQAKSAGGGIQMAMTNIKAGMQRNLANILDAINQMTAKFGGMAGALQKVVPAFDKVGDTVSKVITRKISLKRGVKILSKDAISLVEKLIDTMSKHAEGIVKVGGLIVVTLLQGIAKDLPRLMTKATTMLVNFIKAVDKQLPKLIESGKGIITSILSGLAKNLPRLLLSAGNLMLDFIANVAKNLPKLIVTGLNAITQFLQGMNKGYPSLISKAFDIVVNIAKTFVKALPEILKAGVSLVKELIKGILNNQGALIDNVLKLAKKIPPAIVSGIGSLWSIGVNAIDTLGKGIASTGKWIAKKAIELAKKVPPAVVEGIGSLWNAGVNAIDSLGKGIASTASWIWDKAKTIAKKVPKAVKDGIGSLLDTGKSAIKSLGNGISSLGSWVAGQAKTLAGKIPTALKNGASGLLNIGKNIVKGLWNGAGAMKDWAVGKFKGLGKSILKGIKSALGIKSPSKEFAKVGHWSVLGLVEGLDNGQRMVAKATENLVSIPTMGMSGLAVNGSYQYGTTASYTIDVPLYINGKEFARATANDMQSALNTRETRLSRTRGIR